MAALMKISLVSLLVSGTYSEKACSASYDVTCLNAVRSVLLDQSAFWFGTSYTTNCPQRQDGRYECINRHSDRTDSLLSRMTGQYSLDPAYMSFIVNVTYTIQLPDDGRERMYDGCGVKVNAPLTTPQVFSIDPLNTSLYKPFDLREQPEVTWTSEHGIKYTVILYDASMFIMHALYANVHGGSVHDGETVVEYAGPDNLLSREGPYVWAVFEQQGVLQVDDVKDYIHSAMENNSRSVYLDELMSRYSLLGPYGVNIMRVTTDEYATVASMTYGLLNRCPVYYGLWLDNYIGQRGGLRYLTFPLHLRVSLDLHFTAPAITYTSCCAEHHQQSVNTTLDYSSYGIHGSVTYRRTPSVTLRTVENPTTTTQTLANKMYSLVLLDATGDIDSTNHNASIHWGVVNIHGTNVTSGVEVYPYSTPVAPTEDAVYLVILFEQTTFVNASAVTGYTADDCSSVMADRCHFRTLDFIQDNSLTPVGIRLLRYTPDPYRKYLLYSVYNVTTKAAECAGQPGYGVPCPLNSGVQQTTPWCLYLLVISFSYFTSRN
ncbi:uncharacterized protein [Haliotis cracherodii]|uniref:uncharacterized protein n=1 Tax=Haliotis cracherodii TaxID=6455 RepID=UPI0039E90125